MKLVTKQIGLILPLFFVLATSHSQQTKPHTRTSGVEGLRIQFKNPPPTAHLRCYWWWNNGYTTTDTITRDLTEMKERGIAGAILVDAYNERSANDPFGPKYGSPGWMTLYLHALQVAASLHMEISLSITDGGDVGILGGSGVEPKDALKILTYTRTEVPGGSAVPVTLAAPAIRHGFYEPIAVLAYPLHHGTPMPGEGKSGRAAIPDMPVRTASHEAGDSMPRLENVLHTLPSVAGEQDTDLKQVVDLIAHTSADGTVHWRFPAGDWEVLRIGYTDSVVTDDMPGHPGLAVDILNQSSFDHYWERVVEPILKASKPYCGTTLRYLVTDSWEAGGTNWTQSFRKEFLARRGYDPIPYLPILTGRILESRDTSDRFLADLRRTVADLLATNYYDHFAHRAAQYGLGTHPEAGGPHGGPMDALRNFREASMMQTEFWAASPYHRIEDHERFFVKESSSAAHIYGKRYVAAEGFSRMGPPWDVSPGHNLKPTFDRALTEGLNRLFWHEFTSSPMDQGKPGIEYFADTHLDPNITWWNQATPLLTSLNRAQFLMQQGLPVADLLYDYGSEVPNFVRLKADDPAHVLPGYDYDVTNEDALLGRMVRSGAEIRTPEGIRYRALALPSSGRLSLSALVWMESYVKGGGTILGPKPVSPPGLFSPAQAAQFRRVSAAMWQDCSKDSSVSYGRGQVYCGRNSHALLNEIHVVPDFAYEATDPNVKLDYIHRRAGTTDIYFIRNQNDTTAEAMISLRVAGRTPELWDADSGESREAAVYRNHGATTSLPVSFPPHGSVFVVFTHSAPLHLTQLEHGGKDVFSSAQPGSGVYREASHLDTSETGTFHAKWSNGIAQDLTVSAPTVGPKVKGPWTITFPPNLGAPAFIAIDHFDSWSESKDLGVRYFSGTATYHASIEVPPNSLGVSQEIWMDLGDVREIATIVINGKDMGTVWHPPYLVRIDGALHAGVNTVELKVTNLWPNRLIGDQQMPNGPHVAKTDITFYTKDSPLLPSGLLSPVTLEVRTRTPLEPIKVSK